jgi:hypothetical protein
MRVLHDLFRGSQELCGHSGWRCFLAHSGKDLNARREIDGNCKPWLNDPAFFVTAQSNGVWEGTT